MHNNVEKQDFSWHAKKVQICCIITFRSRFSHDAPKTLIFDALLRGKAGFLMRCQKVQICCIITYKNRFSHDAPKLLYFMHYYMEKQVFSWHAKRCKFVALLPFEAGFLMKRQKLLYVGHPISSDNGLIFQKLILKSKLYYPLHVAMSVAYACLKYEVLITTLSDAKQICIQHYESPWPRKSRF